MANAYIHIRGRRDPIIVSAERGQTIKRIRFGTEGPQGEIFGKADPHDDIDLGDWCGEVGQIRAIEFEKEAKSPNSAENQEIEAKKINERWIKQPADQKAKHYEYFKICWSSRHGFKKVEIPQDVIEKVYQIQLEYFRTNPTASAVPSENFDSILPPKGNEKTLAEKMRVNIDDIPA